MSVYRIGTVSRRLGLSADTLRYYERIGLLPRVGRAPSGMRLYDDTDLARLRFVRRAQKMDCSLVEIGELLRMREAPDEARAEARTLTEHKLEAVQQTLRELCLLRDELAAVLERCRAAEAGCPIIERIDSRDGPT